MTNRTPLGFLLFVLAAGLAGCNGDSLPPPTAPTTVQPPPTPPTPSFSGYHVADVELSGVVYEMTPTGRVPIAGVRVTDYFHVHRAHSGVTNSQGFFSFGSVWVCPCSWAPWVDGGITSIWVDKDGYEAPAGQPASVFERGLDPNVRRDLRLRDVTINGDTQFDIELVKR
jgi:hypothetical protein